VDLKLSRLDLDPENNLDLDPPLELPSYLIDHLQYIHTYNNNERNESSKTV